jgi:glycosyltransferase involved in cell wall biosynthesis
MDGPSVKPSHRRRILMTVDAVGGVWRYAVDLAADLRAVGVDTVFAGFGPEPTTGQRYEAEAAGITVAWCVSPLDWTVQTRAELDRVPDQIATLARRHEVDLVQLNMPGQGAGLDVSVPILAVSHSCVPTWFAAVRGTSVPADWHWQVDMMRDGLNRATAIVTPSQSQADLLAACYGPLPPMHVIHNASPVARHKRRTRSAAPYFLASGRWWDEGKNAAVLDCSAPLMPWPLVMVGADTSPGGGRIAIANPAYRGLVEHREAVRLVAGASAFVAPSIYEPFGLAVLEAARLGLPLILSDIPTFRELWGDAALFFPPRDAEALADVAGRIATDADLRKRMGERARRRAAIYAPKAQVARMRALYDRLCAAPMVAAPDIALPLPFSLVGAR